MQGNVDLKSILAYNKPSRSKRREGMQDSIIFKGGEHPKDYIQYLGQSSFIVSSHEIAKPFMVRKVDGSWVAEENEIFKGGELQNTALIKKLEEITTLTSFNAFEGLYNPYSNSMRFELENGATVEIPSSSFTGGALVLLLVTVGDQKTKVYAYDESNSQMTWNSVSATPFSIKEFVDGESVDVPNEALDVLSNIISEAAPYILAVGEFNKELDDLNYVDEYEEEW